MGVGIEVSPPAIADFNVLRAGGSVEADHLYSLLKLGQKCRETLTTPGPAVTLAWFPSTKGPAVIAKGTVKVVAALISPFDRATCSSRRARRLAVDQRGPVHPPNDLTDWWPVPPFGVQFVDAYNAMVLAVRDITATWISTP